MYFFYIDESGEKNPAVKKDEPFVLIALSLHEYQWKKFEHRINKLKIDLLTKIYREKNLKLELADAEVRSSDVRIPANKNKHIFLRELNPEELKDLTDLYYKTIEDCHMNIFATVIDKSCIDEYFDIEKMIKKSYEFLLERTENFLSNDHPNQKAMFIFDNTSKQLNKSIAMKHSYFLREGTSVGIRLNHIVEMPLFVESYLSNGVQLADLCAYNIYRAFKEENEKYEYFKKLLPYFYKSKKTSENKIDGLKVFPDNHKWTDFLCRVEKERVHLLNR